MERLIYEINEYRPAYFAHHQHVIGNQQPSILYFLLEPPFHGIEIIGSTYGLDLDWVT